MATTRSAAQGAPRTDPKPWQGDACSLVEAFRRGDHSPAEELEATLSAVGMSDLNAISFLDTEAAMQAARTADVSLPFGGVPMPVKELESVTGWPDTSSSVPLRDLRADHDRTVITRLREAGAVLFGQSTSSEFGGVNLTRTKLNGATHNPWDPARTPGGSSGGAAAAVAGGLATIATGGDGGGSIRIPASFCGMPGLKVTYGRFPGGPHLTIGSLTAVWGCLSRSVRDTARWIDVGNGHDSRDPYSLPRVRGWEAGLGTYVDDLRGLRVAITPDLGAAVVDPDVAATVLQGAETLVASVGLKVVERPVAVPELSLEWALAGLADVRRALADRYPDCHDDLTPEIQIGLQIAGQLYNLEARARVEAQRTAMNEAMAAIFDDVDLVITSTCPDVAFAAEGPLPTNVAGRQVSLGNNGALTIPSNIYGNPAISIPVGTVRGMPVGMQVLARHHDEALLLDLARIVERERPWPLVA